MIVSAVFLRPHGIDAARHAEGKKIEKDLLILLKAPCPQARQVCRGSCCPRFQRLMLWLRTPWCPRSRAGTWSWRRPAGRYCPMHWPRRSCAAIVWTSAASAISGRLISSAPMAAVLWSVRLSIREAGRVDVSATSTVSTEPSSLVDGLRRGCFLRTISRENIAAVDIEFAVVADPDNRSGDGQCFRRPDILAVLVDRVDALGDFIQAFRIFGVRVFVGVPGGLKRGVLRSRAASSLASFAGSGASLGMHP